MIVLSPFELSWLTACASNDDAFERHLDTLTNADYVRLDNASERLRHLGLLRRDDYYPTVAGVELLASGVVT